MEVDLFTPAPVVLAMACMHVTTEIACPLRLYAYSLIGLSPPGWLTSALFVASSVCNIGRLFGARIAFALHAVVGGLYLMNKVTAAVVVTAYIVLAHTPMHYYQCWRRGQRLSIAFAVWMTVAMGVILRLMRPSGVFSITYQFQKLVIAHAFSEWRIHDHFDELREDRKVRAVRRARRRARRTYFPQFLRSRFILEEGAEAHDD